jgi:ABC-type proline/glycine betaine transport system permease subunit
MSDPSTYWLTFTNAALGIIVLACCVAVGIGIWLEIAARRKKAAELSKLVREVADLVASYDGHAFNVPGLGVTMADGGEELGKKDKE